MGLSYRTPNSTALVVVPANTATPKAFSTTPLPCTQALVMGFKAARTPNATDAWIGPVAGNDLQTIQLPPSGVFALTGVDLSEWYVDSTTAGDGVIVIYW